jgi:hypothetical protein
VDPWINGQSAEQPAPNLLRHIKPRSRKATVAEGLNNDTWAQMIRGTPSIQALVEYLQLWDMTRKITLTKGMSDTIT